MSLVRLRAAHVLFFSVSIAIAGTLPARAFVTFESGQVRPLALSPDGTHLSAVNTPLLPVRTLAGGAEYAWNTTEWWPWHIAILGPAVTLFCGAWGVIEGAWWITTGLADTLTGGYFVIAPERATHLSVQPEIPVVIADAAPTPTPTEDRCGRPSH